jgi:hypothetical protein
MKPATILIVGALVVALAIVGYLYYQRTRNDITIQLPKVGSILDRNNLWHAALTVGGGERHWTRLRFSSLSSY